MPTARELLEQADALMRRNRARAAALAPSPVPEVREVHVAPEVQAVPAVDPAGDHGLAQPPRSPVAEPPRIEPVRISAAEVVADAVKAAAPPAEEDFPLLTDVVEEIEAPAVVAPDAEGEPSDWLDLEKRHGEPSVTGPAPDSVAVVPLATLRAVDAAPLRAPDGPAVIPVPAPAGPAVVTSSAEEKPDAMIEEPVEAPPPTRSEVVAEAPAETVPRFDSEFAADKKFEEELEPAPVTTGAGATAAVAEAGAPLQDVTPGAGFGAPPEALARGDEPQALEAALPPARPEPAAAPPAWDALAEEVRMQVLQRIDIFTDTGLREKLGERLKPIVDRASADLVATINQHVGDLLRAYVAEAIEREIERWRDNHR